MIIIIKKDGQIVTDDGNPIEGKALEGAYMLLADAQDGDSIVYDGTNHMWKAGSGGGSFAPDITDPQDGDTLVYNATQQKWVNGAGGGTVLCVDSTETKTGSVLGNTWQEIFDVFANGGYAYVRALIGDTECAVGTITNVNYYDGAYGVTVIFNGGLDRVSFTTSSSDGYPESTEE